MELNRDESAKKPKSLTLKSSAKSAKAHKIWNSEEDSQSKSSKGDLDDEKMTFIIKRFQYLANKNNRFSGRSNDFRGSSSRDEKDDQKAALTARSMVTSFLNVHSYKRIRQRRKASRRTASETYSRRVSRQHGMRLTMKKTLRKMKNKSI